MKNKLTIYSIVLKHKLRFSGILVIGFLSNITYIAIPLLMGVVIDQIIGSLSANTMNSAIIDLIFKYSLIIIALSIVSALCAYIQEFMMASFSEKIGLSLRENIINKMNRLPVSFFDKTSLGNVLSEITLDVNRVTNVFLTSINQLITSVFIIILAIGMLLYIDVYLTIIVIVFLFSNIYVSNLIAKYNYKSQKSAQTKLGNLSSFFEEYLTGNNVVQAFNQQNKAVDKLDVLNKDYTNDFIKSQFIYFSIYPGVRFLNQLGFIVCTIIGALIVLSGGMSVGLLQAFLQYVNLIVEPITNLGYVINSIQGANASLAKIQEIYDEIDEVETGKELISDVKGEIVFENVSFGYVKDKMVMKDININIRPKQKVAIVGPTGAGKTTLVNILMRFYDYQKGNIYIDGKDIKNYLKSSSRQLFGMVLQDTWLFEGSVADNIAYGKSNATREEIIEAAKKAQADHFIRTLPNGYDTILDNSDGLISQGQKQLLTIARAFLANPQLVILDEATSSIDTRTEQKIQQAMDELTSGKTSFVIAHRLSTIKNADLILVMQDGNIVETGNHKTLLEENGLYAQLHNSSLNKI